jgi:hypothetical protein
MKREQIIRTIKKVLSEHGIKEAYLFWFIINTTQTINFLIHSSISSSIGLENSRYSFVTG